MDPVPSGVTNYPPTADAPSKTRDEILDYELPSALKLVLDASIEQSNAFGVIMSLFAATLMALDSRVGDSYIEEDNPASWKALRFFLYSATMLNLCGAFLSLMIIKMCSDVRLNAYQRRVQGAAGVRQKKAMNTPRDYGSINALLETYHLGRGYRVVNQLTSVVSFFAWVCTFVTLSIWVLIGQPLGWPTMVLFGFAGAFSAVGYGIAITVQEWT